MGYLPLEAPHEYVQHGPLLGINWLRLCPQFGACVRSHAVRKRLFIVLMKAAYISPNIFSLRNFLSNIHILLLMTHSHHSYLLYISFIRTIISFIYITFCSTSSAGLHGRPAALGLLCPLQLFYHFSLNCIEMACRPLF